MAAWEGGRNLNLLHLMVLPVAASGALREAVGSAGGHLEEAGVGSAVVAATVGSQVGTVEETVGLQVAGLGAEAGAGVGMDRPTEATATEEVAAFVEAVEAASEEGASATRAEASTVLLAAATPTVTVATRSSATLVGLTTGMRNGCVGISARAEWRDRGLSRRVNLPCLCLISLPNPSPKRFCCHANKRKINRDDPHHAGEKATARTRAMLPRESEVFFPCCSRPPHAQRSFFLLPFPSPKTLHSTFIFAHIKPEPPTRLVPNPQPWLPHSYTLLVPGSDLCPWKPTTRPHTTRERMQRAAIRFVSTPPACPSARRPR